MDEGNRRDLQVHGADAHVLLAQALKLAGRLIIKRHDLPTRKEVKYTQQLLISGNLAMHIV
jgi:hypothetical protein